MVSVDNEKEESCNTSVDLKKNNNVRAKESEIKIYAQAFIHE